MPARFQNALYDYSDAATIQDVLPNEFCDNLGIENHQVRAKFKRGKRVKRLYARHIFFDFLNLLMEDCINTNAVFIANCFPQAFRIFIKKKLAKEISYILDKNAVYQAMDLLKSDGNIYEFVYCAYYKGRVSYFRAIRINHARYCRIIKNVNNGKRYHP